MEGTLEGGSGPLNGYKRVVRARVLRAFRRMSEGDASAALALMAPDVRYWFSGQHALGGQRTTRVAVEKWFGRLFRLFRSHFVVRSVEVAGWPWRSTVVTVFEDHVSAPFGAGYVNEGVQVTELRWGKAVSIRTYVDTARLEAMLALQAANGVAEAAAPPIVE